MIPAKSLDPSVLNAEPRTLPTTSTPRKTASGGPMLAGCWIRRRDGCKHVGAQTVEMGTLLDAGIIGSCS